MTVLTIDRFKKLDLDTSLHSKMTGWHRSAHTSKGSDDTISASCLRDFITCDKGHDSDNTIYACRDLTENKPEIPMNELLKQRQEYLHLIEAAAYSVKTSLRAEETIGGIPTYDEEHFNEVVRATVELNTGLTKQDPRFKVYQHDVVEYMKRQFSFHRKDIRTERLIRANRFTDTFNEILKLGRYEGAVELHASLELRGVEHNFLVLGHDAYINTTDYVVRLVANNKAIVADRTSEREICDFKDNMALFQIARYEHTDETGNQYFGFLDRYYELNEHLGSEHAAISIWIGNFIPKFV